MLVFLDLEMTGLDPDRHKIIEVGCVLVNDDLDEIDRQGWVVKQDVNLKELDPVVVKMHERNNLWSEVPDGFSLDVVEHDAIQWLERRHNAKSWMLAGSSIYFDRAFLKKYMPLLERRFHYRMVDVSSFKEMMKRWMPDAVLARSEEPVAHRAVADCLGSIDELRYYREILVGE